MVTGAQELLGFRDVVSVSTLSKPVFEPISGRLVNQFAHLYPSSGHIVGDKSYTSCFFPSSSNAVLLSLLESSFRSTVTGAWIRSSRPRNNPAISFLLRIVLKEVRCHFILAEI